MSRYLIPMLLSMVIGMGMAVAPAAAENNYAEKLGWPTGSKVVILHVDDAGMSHDSNVGTLRSVNSGLANSFSVMMTCPWVPEIVREIRANPDLDAGLHLTLTSEWENYRWGPLAGKPSVPGLVDKEGALFKTVASVVANASADEVEKEIRAQIARARTMGFEPTHLDSHMGTLFANTEFLQRYIKVGIDTGIPVMFPGGHATLLTEEFKQTNRDASIIDSMRQFSKLIWQGGLPVLDDLHNTSYGWIAENNEKLTDRELADIKVARYSETFRQIQPGVTMVIMHATDTSDTFREISASGNSRRGDMLAMLDPRLRKVFEEQGLELTTWRELKARRKAVQ